ncbi:MAG: hypothetical protein WCT18_00460 [Patescibacteria group bacterium]
MIIVKNNQPQIEFLQDVRQEHDYLFELKNLILEFLIREKQLAYVESQKIEFVPISGLAQTHHENLGAYLNDFLFRDLPNAFARVACGKFADFPLTHYWLRVNDLLVDLSIKQFANKPIPTFRAYGPLLENHIFISDNANNPIYKMYNEI